MPNENEAGNEILFRDSELIISSARIEQDGFSCAAKYISTLSYSHDNPSKTHAWVGLLACAVAILTSMLYLYLGKLGVGIYLLLHLVVLVISAMICYLYLLAPSSYGIDVSLHNGQKFRIKRSNEKNTKEIYAAINEALARNRPNGQDLPLNQAPQANHFATTDTDTAAHKTLPLIAGRR